MIVGYILAGENFPTSGSDGPFSCQDEHLLKEALIDAILENPSLDIDDFDDNQWGKWGDEDADDDNKHEEVYGKELLSKLLTRVLSKFDVPGLEYHSSTVGRLFKSGFGRFGLGQAKPSLADQNVILVFVIGGINGLEVREAQEALSEGGRPDIKLLRWWNKFSHSQ
ncbi:hypothetical protein L6164_022448 [Bauhinia variegata]|uniref:Uncharacterized protein n=1 Tax=Bauhinia variegata TaxID=167791 RepID=A0ACB9MF14_BAUVA|nr:hypothetical protein L6164_022448 [Bauhinia variegata]